MLRNDSQLRLNTYLNWPQNAFVDPRDLCDDGFYYTGLEDKVQCTHCGGILGGWEQGDTVANEHSIHFPQCPWVNTRRNNPFFQSRPVPQQCGPITVSDSQSLGFSHQQSGFGFGHQPSSVVGNLQYLPASHPRDRPGTNRPKYPEYSLESNRLTTFKGWPSQLSQKPAALAKSGLFYLGQSDRCKCFYCGGILYDWDTNDDVWVEHAKWFSECPWIKLSKGEPFIRQVQLEMQQSQNQGPASSSGANALQSGVPSTSPGMPSSQSSHETQLKTVSPPGSAPSSSGLAGQGSTDNTPAGPSSAGSGAQVVQPSTSLQKEYSDEGSDKDLKSIIKENQTLKDERTCKICMDEEVSVVFLPCGHIACCAGCSVNVKDCPICRADIVQKIKAYWSL